MRIKIYIVAPRNKENEDLLNGICMTAYLSKKRAEKATEGENIVNTKKYNQDYVVFTRWLKIF